MTDNQTTAYHFFHNQFGNLLDSPFFGTPLDKLLQAKAFVIAGADEQGANLSRRAPAIGMGRLFNAKSSANPLYLRGSADFVDDTFDLKLVLVDEETPETIYGENEAFQTNPSTTLERVIFQCQGELEGFVGYFNQRAKELQRKIRAAADVHVEKNEDDNVERINYGVKFYAD